MSDTTPQSAEIQRYEIFCGDLEDGQDLLVLSAQGAMVKHSDHLAAIAKLSEELDEARRACVAWGNCFMATAKTLGCLASSFPYENGHVTARASALLAERDAALAEVERVRGTGEEAQRRIEAMTAHIQQLEASRDYWSRQPTNIQVGHHFANLPPAPAAKGDVFPPMPPCSCGQPAIMNGPYMMPCNHVPVAKGGE